MSFPSKVNCSVCSLRHAVTKNSLSSATYYCPATGFRYEITIVNNRYHCKACKDTGEILKPIVFGINYSVYCQCEKGTSLVRGGLVSQ